MEDLHQRVDHLEGRVDDLEDKVDGLDGRVGSLEKWVPILIQDNKDAMRTLTNQIDKIEKRMDESNKEYKEIVKEASTRVPKWAMWVFGLAFTLVITGFGWVVEAIIFKK